MYDIDSYNMVIEQMYYIDSCFYVILFVICTKLLISTCFAVLTLSGAKFRTLSGCSSILIP